MKKLLIKNATIYTGCENKILKNTDILIEDNKIISIDTNLKDAEAQVIDATNKFIIPGIINLHAHLFGSGKPSKRLGVSRSQRTLMRIINSPLGILITRIMVKKYAKMALMGGVTTIRSSGDLRYSDVWLRNKNYKDVPRLIVPGPAITSNIGHGHGTFALTSDDPNELRELVRQNVAHGVDYIKACTTGGIMDSSKKGDPGVVKVTKEQLFAIVDEAHKHGLKVASHTESEKGLYLDVDCGVDFIEHGALFNDEYAEKMKKQGTAITITLTPSVAFVELPSDITMCGDLAHYNSLVVTNNMITCAKKALKDGISLALGTDSACPFAFQHLAYREMLYMQKMIGVTALKALEHMTIGNAKLLGLDKEIGSIEENKIADLLIMSEDPAKNIDAIYDLDLIIHNGNCFKQKKYNQFKEFEKIMIKFKCLSYYPLND